jgi:rhomboid family GlyGly-CTERM serine protease
LVLASGLFELLGDTGRAWLQYDRVAIGRGEVWRLISGHFVHLGLSHYILNALGLILVWLLVGMHFSAARWLVVTAVSIVGVNAGLWLFDPQIIWYVGMSGVLHGMLLAGVVAGLKTLPQEVIPIGIVVLAKIGYEQFAGPLPGSEQTAGGNVLVDAHLYGALAGLGIAAVFWRSISAAPTK